MTAQYRRDLLAEVSDIVAVDRNTSYGEPEDNFAHIAQYWSILFGVEVSAIQVAEALALMKIARASTGDPTVRDHWLDLAGYAACAGDIAAEMKKRRDVSGNGVPDRLYAEGAVAKL